MENSKKISCSCSAHHPLKKSATKAGKKTSVLNMLAAVVLFLFPKCPLCWAAYASVFSFLGLDAINYNPNWRYFIISIFLIGSFLLIRKHYLNKSWMSILFYGLGMSLLFITYYLNLNENWWLYIVLFLIVLSNFSKHNSQKLINLLKRPFIVTT